MNFEDEDGPQRPIGGSDSLDRKIAESPSPYALAKGKKKATRPSNDGEAGVTICDADVLCGRGKTSFNHPGNKRFRDLITAAIPEYNKSESRLEKSLVVHSIVEKIRNPGGRFLKIDQTTGKWTELDDRASREKVGHAVRDAATTTQTRREKKRQAKSQFENYGMANILPAMQGPTASRYAEMKMDTPDPVSFFDMMHFSNLMGAGPLPVPAFPALLEPRPIGEHLNSTSMMGRADAQNVATRRGTSFGTEQEHPLDEAVFLAQIDEVLGPMPPDLENDPLAELLKWS